MLISFQVKEIAIDGRYFNQMTEKFSKKALQTGGNLQPPIQEFLENAVIVSTMRSDLYISIKENLLIPGGGFSRTPPKLEGLGE